MTGRFPAIKQLLPHRPPMLLLTDIVEELTDGIVCVGSIPPDHFLVREARAPVVLGIELAAQAAGAHAALQRRATSTASPRPVSGLLVGIREGRFHIDALPAGELLTATVRLIGATGPLAIYEGRVSMKGRAADAVTCRFSTYATDR